MSAAGQRKTARGPFDGVLNILRYNWTQYTGAAVVVIGGAAVLALWRPSPGIAAVGWSGVVIAAAWALASLVVSHVVYDRSALYRWTWLGRVFAAAPQRWATVHAGLDESTAALTERFSEPPLAVLDIFDPAEMTERSIARARQDAEGAPRAAAARFSALPLASGGCDAIMIILGAHELRRATAREAFFGEVRRALAPGGVAVVVEHLRDAANFAAFGPGFVHFHSRRTWLRTFSAAGLHVCDAFGVTPFVAVFVLTPAGRIGDPAGSRRRVSDDASDAGVSPPSSA